MQKLLSLPPGLIADFYDIEQVSTDEWFVCSDPENAKVGSGGGTAWLLAQDHQNRYSELSFSDYLKQEKKILIHAGGQSRRLPAYAPSGKVLTPIPVFRWSRGQRIDQNLLSIQVSLYQQIMELAHPTVNTLIASGDVYVSAPCLPSSLPQVDVLCFGIWVEPHLASRHGVFFSKRNNPQELDFMLQKPNRETIEQWSSSHLFMMDVGIWLLSDKAIDVLMRKSDWSKGAFANGIPSFYDLYSSFGTCLGHLPSSSDKEINELSVAVLPLKEGEFYHYGTSLELITSTEKIQNSIRDQRSILHHRVKPHPSLFVQNAIVHTEWSETKHHIWIENSFIPETWQLHHHHIITGIPHNNWSLKLDEHICLDIVPVDQKKYCIRPYGMSDAFSGPAGSMDTMFQGIPLLQWLENRNLTLDDLGIDVSKDIQQVPLFPVVESDDLTQSTVDWLVNLTGGCNGFSGWYKSTERLSAEQIGVRANLKRLYAQRDSFRKENVVLLAENHKKSVFYQSDLKHLASVFAHHGLQLPKTPDSSVSQMTQIQDRMFRSEFEKQCGQSGSGYEKMAFEMLRDMMVDSLKMKCNPVLNIYSDQIVWGRSPVRLDLAGGWSDTPPFCIQNGGKVVNVAVNLNGQSPLQVFMRLSEKPGIVLRSIDNGVSEEISSFEELKNFSMVGSAFSIPKAALCLAGFHPDYCEFGFGSLTEQLKAFGGGLEISLLAAVPKGSGLGTSSILAATLLGSLSDFCSLNWDKREICYRTLILEQLLTTGGGWQDQYGGVIGGVKLLESDPGLQMQMGIRWLPATLFTSEEYRGNWLLYYTGITRVAKNILSEIVRGMFLNENHRLQILNRIKSHALDMYDAWQRNDYELALGMIAKSWKLNNLLDPGTNTPEIQTIINQIDDLSLGYKLLGAGGGGYMLIGAKDHEAAARIKKQLFHHAPNAKARFVDIHLNEDGFQVTRS